MPDAVRVRGLRELNRAMNRAPLVLKREYRQAYRQLAEPVRAAAESKALTEIRNIDRSPQWGRMRIGANQRLVYVAPKQRGYKAKGRHPSKRPNLGNLLMDRAMAPALAQHQNEAVRRFDQILQTVGRDWER